MDERNMVIIFFDGSKRFITQPQAEQILNQSCLPGIDGIHLDKTFYFKFSSISKILSLQEFYGQYPKEVPEELSESETLAEYRKIEKPNLTESQAKERQIRKLEGLIRGVTDYINSTAYKGTGAPKELLKKFSLKLKFVKKGKQVSMGEQFERYL